MAFEAAAWGALTAGHQPAAHRQPIDRPTMDDSVQTPHSNNTSTRAASTATTHINDNKMTTPIIVLIDQEKKKKDKWFKIHADITEQFITDSWKETMNDSKTPVHLANAMKLATLTARSMTIFEQVHEDDLDRVKLVIAGFQCARNTKDKLEPKRFYTHPHRREVIMECAEDNPLFRLKLQLLFALPEFSKTIKLLGLGRNVWHVKRPYLSIATFEQPNQSDAFRVMQLPIHRDGGYRVNTNVNANVTMLPMIYTTEITDSSELQKHNGA
jgi:hypothetical protein